MEKINVINLIFEMGRRCNMNCPHCLRAPSQNVSLNMDTIYKTLDQVEYINNIGFSGGEPVLYADNIIKTIDYIINNRISCGGFYIASNGKEISLPLMLKLAEFYAYCYDFEGSEVEYTCIYDISTDQYHETIPDNNLNILKAFRFVREKGMLNPEYIIDLGNATENGIGTRTFDVSLKGFTYDSKTEFNPEEDYVDMIYINSNGLAFPDCDFSYEVQDNWGAWNVNDKSLEEIVSTFATKEG